ncbi:MobH family relaxase [Pectobacterium actinidiae]|uniref:MobH family relaxase n=1 Tax=Pectobacterium actinidiae TaxID=1507808 RepID=UPI0037FACC09
MLSLFQRKKPAPPEAAPTVPPKGLTRPQSATSLLDTPRRRKLMEHIWQRTSLSRQQFAWLYRAPLERYAELVQQFPASESHHHAYLGGMLDHGLEIVAFALKLRQSYLLPAGSPPEDQAAQAEAWTAAVAYAALLHDIGKIAVDLHIEHEDGSIWHPWHGALKRPYRFRYREDREYRLHGAATGLLYHQLLDPRILDWLSGYPTLWASLLYVLAGQYEHAGVLGELVVQADRASVAQELGGDPARAMAAPKHALQRKLLDGLRYLLREELKLNQPQASDGWLTQEALWLVSKTVSDKLRAHLLTQGIDGIPSSNTAVFNVLQDHGILQPTADDKAIWKATVTSSSGWSHSFTLLKLSPALIWEANERPEPFTGTVQVEQDTAQDPSGAGAVTLEVSSTSSQPMEAPAPRAVDGVDALLDLFAEPGVAVPEFTGVPPPTQGPPPTTAPVQAPVPTPSPSPPRHAATETVDQASAALPTFGHGSKIDSPAREISGEHFLDWLRHGIQVRKLIINDAKALVHTVADTAYLVSPGLFQRYAQEHPQIASLAKQDAIADWQWVQKRFEKLLVHRKQDSGLNIWTCEVTGPRKSRRLHGYLLEKPERLFDEVPPNNPYLRVL